MKFNEKIIVARVVEDERKIEREGKREGERVTAGKGLGNGRVSF